MNHLQTDDRITALLRFAEQCRQIMDMEDAAAMERERDRLLQAAALPWRPVGQQALV